MSMVTEMKFVASPSPRNFLNFFFNITEVCEFHERQLGGRDSKTLSPQIRLQGRGLKTVPSLVVGVKNTCFLRFDVCVCAPKEGRGKEVDKRLPFYLVFYTVLFICVSALSLRQGHQFLFQQLENYTIKTKSTLEYGLFKFIHWNRKVLNL